MPRSRIDVSGALDTWIRELPRLGRGNEVRDEWADATHYMLLRSREVTHIITGQLRGTSYSVTEQRGSRVDGELWWPATNPRDGTHYGIYEFKGTERRPYDVAHDAPKLAFRQSADNFRDALGRALERQVERWG